MIRCKQEIAQLLKSLVDMEPAQIEELLEIPPRPEMGDLSFPCFTMSARQKQPPPVIAAGLARELDGTRGALWQRAAAAGPYLNFYIDPQALGRETLIDIFKGKERYGGSTTGRGRTVVIDYSSPNIAKPFGIGHLRSTVIGHSLNLVFSALGFNCIGINHLGDWGTQFGKIIVAFKRWGEEEELRLDPVNYLFQLYVQFHQQAGEDPSLEDDARLWFKMLEQGNPEAEEYWRKFRSLSLENYQRLYSLLGIEFNYYHGESHYNQQLNDTIKLVKEKGIAVESKGALVVDLEKYGLPPCLLQKKDGATLYITRDIAAAIYRYQRFKFDKALYVVGAEQTLHFEQLFKILELLGFDWARDLVHVPFGLIRFKGGRMSTREGKIILLEEVLEKAVSLAREIIEEKNPELEEKDQVAQAIGLGAVRFGDLSNDRVKDIEFDWNKVMDFAGETASYVQYSHARICSILRKAPPLDEEKVGSVIGLLKEDEEAALLKLLSNLPEKVLLAAESYRPSIIARYLLEVAREFNRFYHCCPVLTSESELQAARLLLIAGTRQVLANGLSLLGIAAPEEM
ncbi:MAG TPA: arginine--tRNA ligase [Firmicutes bacterium]|nr:arginine--tRNA ligase [Bacillota bacterium]